MKIRVSWQLDKGNQPVLSQLISTLKQPPIEWNVFQQYHCNHIKKAAGEYYNGHMIPIRKGVKVLNSRPTATRLGLSGKVTVFSLNFFIILKKITSSFIQDLTSKHLMDRSRLSVHSCVRKSHFLTWAQNWLLPKVPDFLRARRVLGSSGPKDHVVWCMAQTKKEDKKYQNTKRR